MTRTSAPSSVNEDAKSRHRAVKSTEPFTDRSLHQLNVKKRLEKRLAEINKLRENAGLKPLDRLAQMYIWDEGTDAPLGLLISEGGSKTFRTNVKLDGKWVGRTLGRFPLLSLLDARRQAEDIARDAAKGIDPRLKPQAVPGVPQAGMTFGAAVASFIETHAKPRQRTWDQTERILKKHCRAWLDTPITAITKQDAFALLDDLRRRELDSAAAVTLRWLKVMWKWASKRDIVADRVMQDVDYVYAKRERDRTYSDAEIKAIWNAANHIDPVEGAYVKLLILLAPRKTALACLERSHLDNADNPTLWTTPLELTKSKKTVTKRVYLTPLPPLAQRIIRGLPRSAGRVFPTLLVRHTRAGQPYLIDDRVLHALVQHGAPADLHFHAMRHTLASWLENKGHSEWERGLVLNHAGSSVTAGYSHGYPLELKRTLLTEWADHVEKLVQPKSEPAGNVVPLTKKRRRG
jgi:integrase